MRDLGVLFDQELSMKQHINKVTSVCFFQLRRLKQVRRILGPKITANLVSAFVTSRLDYCNALLAGLPKSTIAPLQRVQNAAARLITEIGYRDHVTPSLQSLHWLPVSYRITYKLSNYLQIVCAHASHSYWMQPNISHRTCHCNIWVVCSSKPTVSQQPTIWSAKNYTEIWWMIFLFCQPNCLERSVYWTPKFVKHC